MKIGPRGMNGASPFMNAQPERDIDSTPAARPTESSSLRIACAIEIAPESEEAQKRLTVIAGHRVREARGERAPPRDVAHPLVRGVDAAGRDVLDALQRRADPLAGPNHRPAEEIVDANVRQGPAVAAHRRSHTAEHEGISHGSPSMASRGAPVGAGHDDSPSEGLAFRSTAGRWVLATAVLGSSMAFLDGTVVNVALPDIGRDLNASTSALQWILNGYLLTLASLILLGGSLGDRHGRRRIFELGVGAVHGGLAALRDRPDGRGPDRRAARCRASAARSSRPGAWR